MKGISERLSAEFLKWESSGRGYTVGNGPVVPEPPLHRFPAHGVFADRSAEDDGRKPTFLSSFVRKMSEGISPSARPIEVNPADERAPSGLTRDELIELQIILPREMRFDATYADFFTSIAISAEPITFEILSVASEVKLQFVMHPSDAPLFKRQLGVFFPSIAVIESTDLLWSAWGVEQGHAAVIEFGLGRELMIPLSEPKRDPFTAIVGALSGVAEDETGLFQVIFARVKQPWHESIVRSVTDGSGKGFFVNAPELVSGAKEKIRGSLYAVVVRVATKSASFERTWEIAANLACALGVYGSLTANELIPLQNDAHFGFKHEEDVMRRQSHRSGMILNSDELAGFVHFPSEEIAAAKLRGSATKTKACPALVMGEGIYLGENVHLEKGRDVRLSNEARVRHVHMVGASGTGKSSLLFNLIRQDLENGEGIAVIDPHGDLIDAILAVIPENRIEDVVLVDPSDEEYSVGFNILSAHSELEKNLLASDLVSVFRRLSTSWGDQLGSVLENAIRTFLESSQGGTLVELRRFLLDSKYREEFLKTVCDPEMVYYWRKAFPQLVGNKSIGSILTRLEMFLSPKAIRHMVSVKENKIDFAEIMNGGKIFLAKLSQGAIGRENSYLLGSLFVAKIQEEAMSRQRQEARSRRDFWLYIDEAHNFLTASMAEILSGARKYRLGLTLAHQDMRQLSRDPEVASALLSNAYTRIAFRVGDGDARELERGFSYFDARDLADLGVGEAICRVERSAYDFNLSVAMPVMPGEVEAKRRQEEVIWTSRKAYGVPRKEIEAEVPVEAPERLEKPESGLERPLPVVEHPTQPELAKPTPKVLTPSAPADLGRGGAQHKAVQLRIKEAAESLGFRVHVEKLILEDAGCVDLVIEREGVSIACEITVTTTIDHEVRNVAKCAKAAFRQIAVVAVSPDKLSKIELAVKNSLGPEIVQTVRFFLPDDFIAYLKAMPPPVQPVASERTSHGYKVKRNYVPVSPEEARAREGAVIKMIAESMKQKKPEVPG